jgi:hypothetical protein
MLDLGEGFCRPGLDRKKKKTHSSRISNNQIQTKKKKKLKMHKPVHFPHFPKLLDGLQTQENQETAPGKSPKATPEYSA